MPWIYQSAENKEAGLHLRQMTKNKLFGPRQTTRNESTSWNSFHRVLQARPWLRYTKNMEVKRLKAMLRAATVRAGFGSSPAMRLIEPQHHDSAHCKHSFE